MKEEKQEDLLADLQDISDSERKTSTAESSIGKRMHAHTQETKTCHQILICFHIYEDGYQFIMVFFAIKGSASGSEEEEEDDEEEESSSQSEENEEGESGSDSEGSDQSAGQYRSSGPL